MHHKSLHRFLRAFCLLVIGILNICYSKEIIIYIVSLTGVLFILPSLFALVGCLRARKDVPRSTLVVPVVSLGAMLFGIVLLVTPATFVKAFMYVMAALLIVIGLWQMSNFYRLRKDGMALLGYEFLVSLLTVAAGMVVLVHPFEVAGVPFVILGAGLTCYGLLEFWNAFLQYKYEKQHSVEEIPEDPPTTSADTAETPEIEEVEAEEIS